MTSDPVEEFEVAIAEERRLYAMTVAEDDPALANEYAARWASAVRRLAGITTRHGPALLARLRAAEAASSGAPPACVWNSDEDGVYETGCGTLHQFMADGPRENRYTHCPYCGGRLFVAETKSNRAGQMTLGQLIDAMNQAPAHLVVKFDDGSSLGSLSSYRGYYDHLALEPHDNCPAKTVANCLRRLSNAVGDTFEGYKGGDYRMTRNTPLWCSEWGDASGVMIVGTKVTGDGFVIETWKEEEDQP